MKDDKIYIEVDFSKIRSRLHKSTKIIHPKKGKREKYKRQRFKFNDYQEDE